MTLKSPPTRVAGGSMVEPTAWPANVNPTDLARLVKQLKDQEAEITRLKAELAQALRRPDGR